MHLCKNPGDDATGIDTDSGGGWRPKDGDKGGEKRWWCGLTDIARDVIQRILYPRFFLVKWHPMTWRAICVRPWVVEAAAVRSESPDARAVQGAPRGVVLRAQRRRQGRGAVQNKHSTNVESPPPPPRLCMSIHPEGKSCSCLGSSACSQ